MSNTTERRSAIYPTSTKAGWRPNVWAADAGISRSKTYELLTAGAIDSVKLGNARIITTSPGEFLASLKDKA